MTVLIAVYNGNKCLGYCDARCYDAHYDDCTCVCGGLNHGVGLQKAQRITFEHMDAIENFCLTTYGRDIDVLSKVSCYQVELFPQEA